MNNLRTISRRRWEKIGQTRWGTVGSDWVTVTDLGSEGIVELEWV